MDKLKHILDGCAAAAACGGLAAIAGWMPIVLGTIGSIMSILWYCLRFYEYFKNKKDIGE